MAPKFREILVLKYIEELDYASIATLLGIPKGTVMSRLHSGRKQLQTALLEYARRKGIVRPPEGVEK